jgi:steroid delta-isomerase-like uncharacterized protein
MSDAESKAVVRRLIEEVWTGGNVAVADEVIATNFVRHGPTAEGEVRGREGLKRLVGMYRTAYPDLRIRLEDQVAEGAQVVTRWTASGTHRGALMGITPTGKTIMVAGVIVDRVVGGKIETEWAFYDVMGMLQQLGAAKM